MDAYEALVGPPKRKGRRKASYGEYDIDLQPALKQGFKLVKRGVFGPSPQERLEKSKRKLKALRTRIENKRLEEKLEELERKYPKKKGFLDRILDR